MLLLNDAANLFANQLVFSLRFQIDCFVGSMLLLAKKNTILAYLIHAKSMILFRNQDAI